MVEFIEHMKIKISKKVYEENTIKVLGMDRFKVYESEQHEERANKKIFFAATFILQYIYYLVIRCGYKI